MSQLTLNAQLEALTGLKRPAGIRASDLPLHIPALAALALVAYDSPETAENLFESVDQMRMLFAGEFGNLDTLRRSLVRRRTHWRHFRHDRQLGMTMTTSPTFWN